MGFIRRKRDPATLRYMGGIYSLHMYFGVKALARERKMSLSELMEQLVDDGLQAVHPEWYTPGHRHHGELEAEQAARAELAIKAVQDEAKAEQAKVQAPKGRLRAVA